MHPQGNSSAFWLNILATITFILAVIGLIITLKDENSVIDAATALIIFMYALTGWLFARVAVANNKMLSALMPNENGKDLADAENQRRAEMLKKIQKGENR